MYVYVNLTYPQHNQGMKVKSLIFPSSFHVLQLLLDPFWRTFNTFKNLVKSQGDAKKALEKALQRLHFNNKWSTFNTEKKTRQITLGF